MFLAHEGIPKYGLKEAAKTEEGGPEGVEEDRNMALQEQQLSLIAVHPGLLTRRMIVCADGMGL